MQIGGGKPSNTPDYDPLAFLMPLQRGTRANTELPPNRRRNRDLPLCSQTGMRNRHRLHYRGTVAHVKHHTPPRGRPNSAEGSEAATWTGLVSPFIVCVSG